MGERELREKYGGKLAKAINRAIRAEIPGGNEALEKLTQLAGAARQSHWEDKQGRPTPEAATYLKHQRDVVGRMEAQVRSQWGIPPAREAKSTAAPRTAPARGAQPRDARPGGARAGSAKPTGPRPSGPPPRSGPPRHGGGNASPTRGSNPKLPGSKPQRPARRKGLP